ncbi:MAG: hypothetical protein LBB72_00165 [Spirochaetaceae bacterium]|nr:hypothetical protein [Spirochaetaceae bacterium]
MGHSRDVSSVAFSPDGTRVLSGSSDHTVKLWDVENGRELKTFSGHSNNVLSVAFSPDGTRVLSGSLDRTVKLWDVESGRELKTFSGHSRAVNSVAFSPEGTRVLSGSLDDTVKLWDAESGRELRTFLGHSEWVNSVAFSPDGTRVLSGSLDHTVKLWDAESGRELKTFSGHSSGVRSVAFSPDGTRVLSGSWGTVKLWDATSGRELRTFSGHSDSVLSVAFSPDGTRVLSGSDDRTVKLWDAESGQELRTFSGHSGSVLSVAFNPDGTRVLSGSLDHTVKLWDAASGRELRTFSGHSLWVNSVAFSPDGTRVLSDSEDHTIKLWDAASGRELRTFSGHSRGVNSVAFSPDGTRVLSGSSDHTVKLWDVESGRELRTFLGHSEWVNSVAFSPDGTRVLSGSLDDTVKLWDAESGQELKTFSGHLNSVISVAFSPEGIRVLSDSWDKTIKLWDTESGGELRTFSGNSDRVRSIAFSPDGKRILSASTDGTTRLWDIATGKEIASFISFDDGEWIVITPDGYYNASPKGDQHLNVRIGNNVYGMDQFAKTFYQPEVVQRRLQGLPDPDYIKPGVNIQTASIPPALKVTAGEVDPLTRRVTLTVTASDWIRQISDVEIIINGRLLGADELQIVSATNLRPAYTKLVTSSAEKQYEFTINLQLDPGLNYIEIVAANDANYGLAPVIISAPQSSSQGAPQGGGVGQKGDLYVLAIGVDKYAPNPAYRNLQSCVSDSGKIIDSFKAQEGKRFNKVHTLWIADDEKNEAIAPTKQNILANMDFLKRAGPNDLAVLFVAAHGKTEDGVYYFLPSDTVFTGDNKFDTESAVNITELTKALDLPGRKIVMLDTCESGGVDNNRLIHNLRNRSTVIFTASQENQYAFENSGGGYFTTEITRGIGGEAANNGAVLIERLGEYVIEQVSKMSFNRQKPVKLVPDGYRDFVISVVE